jgi:hypothetical protein
MLIGKSGYLFLIAENGLKKYLFRLLQREQISILLSSIVISHVPQRGIGSMQKTSRILMILAITVALWGCATRSISNSGYPGDGKTQNPYYSGELNEMDVLGCADAKSVSETDIKEALENRREIKLRKGSAIIVIQSGAIKPDEPMIDELNRNFVTISFSGTPSRQQAPGSYSKSLRMAAAQGGCAHILCYWGTIETAVEDRVTKAVSWIPVAGAFVPDESQQMRIRLKAALIDVVSGKWVMLTPDPIDDSALSSVVGRVKSDQKQVSELKKRSYATLASELVRYFSM